MATKLGMATQVGKQRVLSGSAPPPIKRAEPQRLQNFREITPKRLDLPGEVWYGNTRGAVSCVTGSAPVPRARPQRPQIFVTYTYAQTL